MGSNEYWLFNYFRKNGIHHSFNNWNHRFPIIPGQKHIMLLLGDHFEQIILVECKESIIHIECSELYVPSYTFHESRKDTKYNTKGGNSNTQVHAEGQREGKVRTVVRETCE